MVQLPATAEMLKNEVIHALQRQKYTVKHDTFIDFIESFTSEAKKFMRDSSESDILKIKPKLMHA